MITLEDFTKDEIIAEIRKLNGRYIYQDLEKQILRNLKQKARHTAFKNADEARKKEVELLEAYANYLKEAQARHEDKILTAEETAEVNKRLYAYKIAETERITLEAIEEKYCGK